MQKIVKRTAVNYRFFRCTLSISFFKNVGHWFFWLYGSNECISYDEEFLLYLGKIVGGLEKFLVAINKVFKFNAILSIEIEMPQWLLNAVNSRMLLFKICDKILPYWWNLLNKSIFQNWTLGFSTWYSPSYSETRLLLAIAI